MNHENMLEIKKTGTTIYKTSKQGGGTFTVTGVKECDRCEKEIEIMEIVEPSKAHRKKGGYYAEYSLCHHCGLYQPNKKTRKYINI